MILGPVSWLDCFVFLFFLAPQLIINVGFFATLSCGLKALPFLLVKLPLNIVYERFILSWKKQALFVQRASWFEDLVIRCVRYAFAYIPARIGRVFFSKPVSLPFFYFRLWRHGYFGCPVHWREIKRNDFTGIWMIKDPYRKPDIVLYYAHGGGFSMGSSYFYLEFLLTLQSLLSSHNAFSNPAVLALDYTLVPDSSYPTQPHEAISGYKYLLSFVGNDSSKIVLSGDSAGGTIMLTLLLFLGFQELKGSLARLGLPGMMVLISPWTTLISPDHKETPSDYLSASMLHQYATQYAGPDHSTDEPLISPGNCNDITWWKQSAPKNGYYIAYGSEEVFTPEIRSLATLLGKTDAKVETREEEGGIHAWAVASLFLSKPRAERLKGLHDIVKVISERMGNGETEKS